MHVILNGKQSLLEKAQSTNPEIVSELKNRNKEYPKTFPTKVSDFSSEQIDSGKNVSH